MNIAEAKEQIKNTVDEYLTVDEAGAFVIPVESQRPVFLLGAPGIGKTAIMSQIARELGIGLVSYSMTHHTRQSALGLPFIVHREFGGEQFDVSEYTMSEIISSMYDYMEKTGHTRGILFLDEINCVSETLYPSMLQFLQFKTFGRHHVPQGWIVVCAGNPPEYNKSVFDFDVVTLDRLRKLDVEPDLSAWMDYARATGVHPAVTSYLEIRPNQFYSIGKTLSGKSFVTARGWDDLSRTIKISEAKGRPVTMALVSQFIQDGEIAERFAQYYLLFSKYRSDYHIDEILAGNASKEIGERARSARIDERLALVRLILDALDASFEDVLERERVIAITRDAIKEAKPQLLDGLSIEETIGAWADIKTADIQKRIASEAGSDAQVRPERLAVTKLRSYELSCKQGRTEQGSEAFEALSEAYKQDMSVFRAKAEAVSEALDNAFAFLDENFGDEREMTAFVAELTARPGSAGFIAKFGSDSYFAHNASVSGNGNRSQLQERVESFDFAAAEAARAEIEAEAAKLAATLANCAACGGCS